MKTKAVLFFIMLGIGIAISLYSCGSDDDNAPGSRENPVLIQQFFLKGVLGEEEFEMKTEIFDPPASTVSERRIDYGGFGIRKVVRNINGEDTEFCFGRYAFGYVQNTDANVATAKLFISDIDLDRCSIDNERQQLEDAFNSESFVYENSISDDTSNRVMFAFFPPKVEGVPDNEQEVYFSREDNANSLFRINSVSREAPNHFVIEGDFSCRMTSLRDDTKFLDLKDGKFRIRIVTNLDRDMYN